MKNFLDKNGFDGYEIIQHTPWTEQLIPKDYIKGFHMRYFPIWLDFWKGNYDSLLKQMGTNETIKMYYGGLERQSMVEFYKKELDAAKIIGAKYLVFHISHVELQHCFNYNFTYCDENVIDCAIELLNEVFADFDSEMTVLFENLWWPGLTFHNKQLMERLMERVNYPNKGFMLDIAHLMNTNHQLESEKEAVDYILEKLASIGEIAQHIRGIHLNSSLSGKYINEQIGISRLSGRIVNLSNMDEIYKHIRQIDQHKPFQDKEIMKVIEKINPDYLVYEFLTSSLEELQEYVTKQNIALGIK